LAAYLDYLARWLLAHDPLAVVTARAEQECRIALPQRKFLDLELALDVDSVVAHVFREFGNIEREEVGHFARRLPGITNRHSRYVLCNRSNRAVNNTGAVSVKIEVQVEGGIE
jgi:hypothetical protein